MSYTFTASAAQRLMWLTVQLDPNDPAYNVPYRITLTGALDVAALRRALNAVVAKHEALRTTFRYHDGNLYQVVHETVVLDVPLTDDDCEVFRHVFDLETGPLLLARLHRLGPGRHELSLVMHHMVFDGWSAGLFFADLATAYSGAALDEPPIQYADYARWQQEQDFERSRRYWQDSLRAAPTALELPADPPGEPGGALHAAAVPEPLAAAARRLANAERCTLFAVLLASFAVLLRDQSGCDDILIGTPAANRGHPDTAGVIGLFVNMLALRADLRGAASYREVLHRVRDTALSGLDHQDLPFDEVLRALSPERQSGRSPLFQVTFWLQQAPAAPPLGEVRVTADEAFNGTAKYDLTLGVRAGPEGLRCEFAYRTDRFDADTVTRMSRRFLLALQRLTETPDQPLTPLVTEDDLRLLDRLRHGPRMNLPGARVHDLIASWMRDTPGARAVAELTYRELRERVERFPPVPAGTRVGVALPRSADLVVAVVAILTAAAVYVPLDLDQPPERRHALAREAGVAMLVAQDGVTSMAAEETGPDGIAYVMYTSGSTGSPKGVEVEHRSLVNRLLWGQDAYPLDARDRVLQVAYPGFDFSVWELLAPLAFGACVVPAPPGIERDPAALLEFACQAGITVAHLVPTLLNAVLLQPGAARWTSLRLLFVGGEALSGETRDQALRTWNATVVNQYGPAEATIDATAWTAEPDVPVAIGRPIANTVVSVVDGQLLQVPPGVVGELLIGGAGLARGYLGRPDLTAESFIEHSGERFYRTGDLVRWASDGQLRYHGRADRQVKIRGRRVEPGEIEATLRAQPSVTQAAVIAVRRQPQGVYLAAYLVGSGDSEAVRAALRRSLPEAMVPAALVWLDRLPLTASGKVDYRALPEPDLGAAPSAGPPLTSLEQTVAEIWRTVLGVEHVARHDNFFDLGGHSLLMIRVHEALTATLSARVRLLDLFEYPTVDSLAAFLQAEGARDGGRLDRADERAARQRESRRRLRERQ
jgi:amino acid adenylation domain-containing protein